MRTALFTGAGASKAIGYPLTKELLPRVRLGLGDRTLFEGSNGAKRDQDDRDRLERYLIRLLPGFRTAQEAHLPLITDVFSLVDYAIASGESLPVGGDRELRDFRDLLKHAITNILIGEYLTPWDAGSEEDRRKQRVVEGFVGWLQQQGQELALITTNYDIGLESELYERIGPGRVSEVIDLGYDWRDAGTNRERRRPAEPELNIFKLHGSLDVLRCRHCGYVYFNPYGTISLRAFDAELSDHNTCICRDDEKLELHIVSPSMVRDIREANLLSVWRSSLEWMRCAERWILFGYSLPPEDLAIRSLLLRARAGAKKAPELVVVQQGESARPVYEMLFPGCRYMAGGVEEFIQAGG